MEKTIVLQKKTIFRTFSIQYGDILYLEIGLIIGYIFINIPFLILQLFVSPLFFLLITSKFNKSITRIEINYEKKIFIIKQDNFMIFSKVFEIPFENISFHRKWKWLFKYYSEVIEIREKNKLKAVIPLTGSIWNEDEIKTLIALINDVEEMSNPSNMAKTK